MVCSRQKRACRLDSWVLADKSRRQRGEQNRLQHKQRFIRSTRLRSSDDTQTLCHWTHTTTGLRQGHSLKPDALWKCKTQASPAISPRNNRIPRTSMPSFASIVPSVARPMTSNLASPFFTAVNANLSPHVVDLNALIADIVSDYCELGSCVKSY
jgi:hypothetical protein